MPPKQARSGLSPTISDVAKAAGVGRATAARTLGGYGYVGPELTARVIDAAKSLGYRPNALAKSMSTGSANSIGVVLSDIGDPFFADLLRGVTDVAKAAGFDTIVLNTDEDLESERQAVGLLMEKRVDGIIVSSAALNPKDAAHLSEARTSGIPVVLVDRIIAGFEADAVVLENRLAARSAVNALLAAGHRRIGIAWGPRQAQQTQTEEQMLATAASSVWSGAERFAGYLDALRDANIAFDPTLVAPNRRTALDAAAQVMSMLSAEQPPTAILATETEALIGTLRAIHASGRTYPGDISLVGFDDSPWAAVMNPSLTMVEQPSIDLGRAAAQRVLQRIAGDASSPSLRTFEARLMERSSIAAATKQRPAATPG